MNTRKVEAITNISNEDKKYLTDIINVVEEDGYIEVSKLQKFIDVDVAILHIRGKDPLLSGMHKCTINVRLLKFLNNLLFKKVHYNFGFCDDELVVSKNVGIEYFDFKAPTDICNFSSSLCVAPDTPMIFLWKLISNGYYFVFDSCAPVQCSSIYFGEDNFSVSVDYIGKDCELNRLTLIEYDNYCYKYSDFYIAKNTTLDKKDFDEMLSKEFELITLKDDLGRQLKCYKVNLNVFEKNILNTSVFNKAFDNVFTYGVLDTAYNICSYINGLSLIEHDLDKNTCFPLMFLPVKQINKFNIDQDIEHNDFTIQSVWYCNDIQKDIANAYQRNKDIVASYLKNKDDDSRDSLYQSFSNECGKKYGKLAHYYINGVLDALAIQKGDKTTRIKILSGYMKTVNKEFLMYGCYLYNLRMMFIRNNYRVSKYFKSALVLSDYNYSYFRVG